MYSFRHINPRLAGALVKERVRCGRQNCHCRDPQFLHGPYTYLYFRDYANGDKLRKEYIPRSAVVGVQKQLLAAKQEDKEEKTVFALHHAAYQHIISTL